MCTRDTRRSGGITPRQTAEETEEKKDILAADEVIPADSENTNISNAFIFLMIIEYSALE